MLMTRYVKYKKCEMRKSWVLDNRNLGEIEMYVKFYTFCSFEVIYFGNEEGIMHFVHKGIIYLAP